MSPILLPCCMRLWTAMLEKRCEEKWERVIYLDDRTMWKRMPKDVEPGRAVELLTQLVAASDQADDILGFTTNKKKCGVATNHKQLEEELRTGPYETVGDTLTVLGLTYAVNDPQATKIRRETQSRWEARLARIPQASYKLHERVKLL